MVRRMRTCCLCKKSYISASGETDSCPSCQQKLQKGKEHINPYKKKKLPSDIEGATPIPINKHTRNLSEFQSPPKDLPCTNQIQDAPNDPIKTSLVDENHSNNNNNEKQRMNDENGSQSNSIAEDMKSNEKAPTYCLSDSRYVCIVCGSSLAHITSGIQGKLNHIKRCAKKNSVTLQDIKSVPKEADHPTTPPNNNSTVLNATDKSPLAMNDENNLDKHKDNENTIIDLISSDEEDGNDGCDAFTSIGAKESLHDREAQSMEAESKSNTTNSMRLSSVSTPIQPISSKTSAHKQNDTLMQPSLTNFFKTPIKSINNVLLEGAKKLALAKKNNTAGDSSSNDRSTKKRHWSRREYPKNGCPSYKRIPGTNFICDGFHYAKPSLSQKYFLTHFHSDHYGGITKNWNAGTIYCSLATANLVHEQLGVQKQYIYPLPMMKPTTISDDYDIPNQTKRNSEKSSSVVVTLIDANHCPGAIMFLFQIGDNNILHVGDFRWDRTKMLKVPPLAAFACTKYRLDELMLDTTYCDKKYANLPTQEEAINATIEVIEKEIKEEKSMGRSFFKKQNLREHSNLNKTLFLFGAYSIGKERIYVSVAKHLGKKVYVDSRRLKMIKAFHWPSEEMDIFTTKKTDSNLWVVPLGHINFEQLTNYMTQSTSRSTKGLTAPQQFERVIGFRPTGWSFSPNRKDLISKRTNKTCTIYGVPYSEHSSFGELVDCLLCLKPKKITPTVSVSKSQEQCELLLDAVREHEEG